MNRFSNRLLTVMLAVALLTMPMAVQAAPTVESGSSWGSAFLQALDDLVQSTWSALEGLVPTGTPTDADVPTTETTTDTQSNPTDTSTDVVLELDPNG